MEYILRFQWNTYGTPDPILEILFSEIGLWYSLPGLFNYLWCLPVPTRKQITSVLDSVNNLMDKLRDFSIELTRKYSSLREDEKTRNTSWYALEERMKKIFEPEEKFIRIRLMISDILFTLDPNKDRLYNMQCMFYSIFSRCYDSYPEVHFDDDDIAFILKISLMIVWELSPSGIL